MIIMYKLLQTVDAKRIAAEVKGVFAIVPRNTFQIVGSSVANTLYYLLLYHIKV